MISRKGLALAAMLLAITFSSPLMAQRTPPNGARGAQPADYRPKAKSKEELDAYNALIKDNNPATRVASADGFLTTYPNSELMGMVQRLRMDALMRSNKFKESIAAAEAGLAFDTKFLEDLIKKADDQEQAAKDAKGKGAKPDKNAPPQQIIDKNSDAFKKFALDTENNLFAYYQALMKCYEQLNDAPHAIEWGQKAVMQNPDDLMSLLTLSEVMAARPPSDPKEMDAQMKQAEEYGKKALTQVGAFVSSPTGAGMPAEQKADLVSGAHDTLGRIYLNEKRFGDAQKEYSAAVSAKKDDGEAYYFMGLALAQDKPPKAEDAMEAFAKSVFLKGPSAAGANDVLKQMYTNVHHDLNGLDDFIKAAGAKIGK